MDAITLEMTSNDQDALRAEVRLIMTQEGLSQAAIAREAGIAYGTFTPWMGGTYKGKTAEIARSVQRWLETRRERKQTAAILPKAPEFVATPTADAIMNVLAFAQSAPDFAVVVGGAGIGKTMAIEEYQKRSSNVFVMTAEPVLSSPNNMLSALADAIGVVERRSTWISRAICNRLRGAAALIVIDEAQHLSSAALDQLRTIQDLAKCGVAVAGNESVYSRLQGSGEARSSQFAQLYSRVGMRVTQPKPRAKDICQLIEAWGIAGAAEIELLKTIARKPGALRGMTKTLRLAGMIAAGASEPLSVRHIRQAWQQLSSQPVDAE